MSDPSRGSTRTLRLLALLTCLAPGLLLLILLAPLRVQATPRPGPPQSPSRSPPQLEIAGPGTVRAWILATGLLLTLRNQEQFYLLGGAVPTEENRRKIQPLLAKGWGVANREQALETLTWLWKEGHRKEYEELAARVGPASEQQYQAWVAACHDDEESLNRLRFARLNCRKLGKKSLVAWDMCRLVNVAGWCYVSGYITASEAWMRSRAAARVVQKTYTSWDDMSRHYLLGRSFWSAEVTRQEGAQWESFRKQCLTDPDTPWVHLPWNMDLTADR